MEKILSVLLTLGHPNIPQGKIIAYNEDDTGIPTVVYLHQNALLDKNSGEHWTLIRKDCEYLIHPEIVRRGYNRISEFGFVYRVSMRYGEFVGIEAVSPAKEWDLINQLVEEAKASSSRSESPQKAYKSNSA